MFELLCCNCCVPAIVYWERHEVNLRKPTGLIIVLHGLRLAECVFVRACFTVFRILIIDALVLISFMPCYVNQYNWYYRVELYCVLVALSFHTRPDYSRFDGSKDW